MLQISSFLKKTCFQKKNQIKSPPNGQLRQLIRFLFNYVIIIKETRVIRLGTSGKSNEMLMIMAWFLCINTSVKGNFVALMLHRVGL